MRPVFSRCCLALLLVLSFYLPVVAQKSRQLPKPKPLTTDPLNPQAAPEPTPPPEPQDIDTLKTDTDLVTVPVIATDTSGTYIPDLQKQEFTISEDGVKQEIAFFGTVSAPFSVVLMLDTSGSTQEKLRLIQQAACAFVDQLQPADRVKVISFDDVVKERNEFTNNRTELRAAINSTRSGQGTKFYDAMELALETMRAIKGRKAIVVFTDGVDRFSDHATYANTLRWIDEEGVIVYPIRYDTRAETERLVRQQAEEQGPVLPTLDVIRKAPTGTPSTFPSDDPSSGPPSMPRPSSGPLGLPTPEEIMRRKRESDRRRDPNQDQIPPDGSLPPDTTSRGRTIPGTTQPTSSRRASTSDDSIASMLDLAYATADGYLSALATKTGGQLLRADSLKSLPDAFTKIAAELRTQYVIGYYPVNKERNDSYRKIKVTTSRKGAVVRARPGYLAKSSR